MTAPEKRMPRLLSLVPYFLARPGISLDQAAADFGITPAQLRKDLDLLTLCGLPGYGPGELIDLDFDSYERGYIKISFDANLDRPLRLTAKEGLALAVALQALAETPGLTDSDVVSRALAKIEAAAGGGVDDSTVAVSVDESVRFVPLLHRAVTDARALALRYYTAARDQTSERTVDPLRVFESEGMTYLQAWCRDAQGIRVFRADRIDDAHLLDEPARPPAGLEIPELVDGVFRPATEHLPVTLLLAPSYRWVGDYYPTECVEDLPDGTVRVRLRVAETAWVRALVLGAGGDVVVVAPADLAESIRMEASAGYALYDGQ